MVGWGEGPPLAAVGTPIPLPAPPGQWRYSAWVQRPGRRGELCYRRPPPLPRLRATAAALPGTQPPPGPGCLAWMLRPDLRGELCSPAPLASTQPQLRSRGCRRCSGRRAGLPRSGCARNKRILKISIK